MKMRTPCAGCGSPEGVIDTRNGQDVVTCVCGRYAYCAPRSETGRDVRPLASRPSLKPSTRWRILEQHDHTCVACGRRPPEVRLDVDHLISVDDAKRCGVYDELIESDTNLAPMCAECNSGKRVTSAGIRLIYRVLLMKAKAT